MTFVLNHGGSPVERTPEFLDAWRNGIAVIAQRPNLVCKVSGFGLHDNNWTPSTIRPMVFDCIDAFGIDRCMWGTDWTRTSGVLTYEQGRKDAKTWADYINVGMEHGAFDMTGLEN